MKATRPLLFVIVLLSAVPVYFLTNIKGDSWEEYVRNGLYAMTGDSIPDYDVDRLNSFGVPYTYYPTQNGITPGNQYNATIVCNYAIAYLDSFLLYKEPGKREHLQHCLQWLQKNLYRHENPGYALFQFHWRQPWYDSVQSPFTCGMTSGLALQLFTRSFAVFKDSSLLTDAGLLLQGFNLPVEAGGFTYKEQTGWWYEEIADTGQHTPRILDGHLFALLGLYDYFSFTGDSLAYEYFSKGDMALRQALPGYDAGHGEIYYDRYGKLADIKYKRILSSQLQRLYSITHAPFYEQFFQKIHGPLIKPYLYRCIRDGNRSGMVLFLLLWGIAVAILSVLHIVVFRRETWLLKQLFRRRSEASL